MIRNTRNELLESSDQLAIQSQSLLHVQEENILNHLKNHEIIVGRF